MGHFIIATTILKKRKYLSEYTTRGWDKKHIPKLSFEVKDAITFTSKELASEVLKNIINPYQWDYQIEPFEGG